MHATILRQVLVVTVAGFGLIFGGASLSRYVDQSPSLLYAAGELHMAFGDSRGGVQLIGRAEAAREALKKAEPVPAQSDQRPSEKPVEVCTRQKRSANGPALNAPQPAQPVMEAMVLPAPPTPPTADGLQTASVDPRAFAQFEYFDRHWRKAGHAVRVIKKFQVNGDQFIAVQSGHGQVVVQRVPPVKVDVDSILKNVHDELARRNIRSNTLMMLQGPITQ